MPLTEQDKKSEQELLIQLEIVREKIWGLLSSFRGETIIPLSYEE